MTSERVQLQKQSKYMSKDLRRQFFILGFILLIPLSFLIASSYWREYQNQQVAKVEATTVKKTTAPTLSINGHDFSVEFARTDAEHEQGLSDRLSMPPDRAMDFVFKKPGLYSFWMKNMHYDLDIFWLDENYKVIYQQLNLSPDTFPNIYTPKKPAKYVVEVVAGTAKKAQIGVGSQFTLSE